ncbi:MAG: aminopeptidase P family protein [Saprospiraceae bacterium]|nr:aminopeptidase P family protein [Saprospiraceae bacterium]
MTINARISALRKAMLKKGIDAYIIPSTDPHQSEYVADHWQARKWISGFDGSAGTVIITKDHAGLWTDSRYFLQAEEQLKGSEMELHKLLIPHTPEHLLWLEENLSAGQTIGLDGWLRSAKQIDSLSEKFEPKKISLDPEVDLIQETWLDRPGMPNTLAFLLETRYSGKAQDQKINILREKMQAANCQWIICSTLDDIAWILNIRGRDISHSPVNISYLFIGEKEAHLFIDASKTAEIRDQLASSGVNLHAYEEAKGFLGSCSGEQTYWCDPASLAYPLYNAIPGKKHESPLPSQLLKACKNETEVKGIRNAMVYDGIALTRLFMWLEQVLKEREVPETEVALKLAGLRAEHPGYVEESFDAIVGYRGNGAIVHYRPEEGSCANIKAEGVLLLDSGGQYHEGTTDITRTVCLGESTQEQRENFTRVLQGHIAIDCLVFPKGTCGSQMDVLARQPLWKAGLNYGHGTGHGVGHFLNVHEGPQGIGSGASGRSSQEFLPGMFTSNEPGFYKTGEYGIRIENLILCVEGPETDFGQFYQFENLTLFPIDQKLIHFPMLRREEVIWLDNYHKKVFEQLSPHLSEKEVEWLKVQCKSLS